MAPLKFVIKCGNFAVLVDLHILPLQVQEDTSWFTTGHTEEVTALVRDAVDQRVKQYTDSLHNRKHPKQKRELAPASAFFMKGKNFHLAANFLKRHSNLRCISRHIYGDLRVFPERYVVCVSRPEDGSAQHGNLSLGVTELSEHSRSEYFARAGETQDPLNSPTKTKKTVLQKIAKQASVQHELYSSSMREQAMDMRACPNDIKRDFSDKESELSLKNTNYICSGQGVLTEADLKVAHSHAITEVVGQIGNTQNKGLTKARKAAHSTSDSNNPNGAFQQEIHQANSKRCKPTDAGEDPCPQRAKRTCLRRPQAKMQTDSNVCSTQTFRHDPEPVLPIPQVEANAQSKAFPVAECKKTTLEVELLTPGKRAQRLPLTSNNTAQTNQNRLAASLRGLSVKPASSGSSISSRSTLVEEGSENVPRTSRLRRLKRS